MDQFANHFKKNKNSLIAKVFGLFTVETNNFKVNIMLMENTMKLSNIENLKYIFDLKGSKVDRNVKGVLKTTTTLKDENFINLVSKKNLQLSRQVN